MEHSADPGLLSEIAEAARSLALELCTAAGLVAKQTVIVGCSTSEIAGLNIGTGTNTEIGAAVFDALHGVFSERGIYLAAQCCEHLNRALVIEREAAVECKIVNAIPIPNAGGAFATAAYASFSDPVMLEEIEADAGLDIGGTLIGMHLKKVAIPLRLATSRIGEAVVIAARVRSKLIGGSRTVYNESLF